jgi:hypothetical protein
VSPNSIGVGWTLAPGPTGKGFLCSKKECGQGTAAISENQLGLEVTMGNAGRRVIGQGVGCIAISDNGSVHRVLLCHSRRSSHNAYGQKRYSAVIEDEL